MSQAVVAVVIPVYKSIPDESEQLSMIQCIKVLNRHPIIFIAPQKLDTSFYRATCEHNNTQFKEIRFADNYFADINGYNKLMLSAFFYRAFIQFKYILIYQLDAYVFKDELEYWCKMNYDFIGAPLPAHQNKADEMQFLKGYARGLKIFNAIFRTDHQISNVGNGGLSLRKTGSCFYLLKLLRRRARSWGQLNEDGFFKYWGNILYPLFRLPSDELALHFAIEQSPAASLKKLNGKMPFGCHAFEKYEPETWSLYIKNN